MNKALKDLLPDDPLIEFGSQQSHRESKLGEEFIEEIENYEAQLSGIDEKVSEQNLLEYKEVLHYLLSELYKNVGELTKAAEHCQSALQLQLDGNVFRQDVICTIHELSRLYKKEGNIEEAIGIYYEFFTVDEIHSEALRLGHLFRESNTGKMAEEFYQRVIDNDSTSLEAMSAYVGLCDIYEQRGERSALIVSCEEMIQRFPHNPITKLAYDAYVFRKLDEVL